MAIIKKIYELSLHNLNDYINNSISNSEFIHLVYSINPEGNKRKVSLEEKLKTFNCSLMDYNNLDVKENNDLPSKLFIIGLFLGYGSIGFVFDSPPSRLPVFYIKIVFNFLAQSNSHYNVQLLRLIAKKMDLKPNIYIRKSGSIVL